MDTSERPGAAPDATAGVTELYQGHAVGLIRLAIVMLGDRVAAEDVVQDAFLGLYRNWDGLTDPAKALAYLRSAVLNRCRSLHRRAVVARRHAPALAGPAAAYPDTAAQAAEREVLIAALRSLPPRQREVLVLRYYADLDVGEIAQILRIGPSTVRSAAARGLARVARMLEERSHSDRS